MNLGKKILKKEKLSLSEKITNFICEKLVRKKSEINLEGTFKLLFLGEELLDQNIGEFLNAVGLPTLQGYGLNRSFTSS